MKNKKGFTLIELLAVIVVLGIILAIAIPKVTQTIESSREGAFKASLKMAAKKIKEDAALGKYEYNTPIDIKSVDIKPNNLKGDFMVTNDGIIFAANVEDEKSHYGFGEEINASDINNTPVIKITNNESPVHGYTLVNNEDGITISNGVLGGHYLGWETDIIIPNGITSINGTFSCYAMEREYGRNDLCMQISSVTIPEGVVTIDDGFGGNNLTSIILPSTLTTIGDESFMGNSLARVQIPNSVTTLGSNAFASNQLVSVNIPNGITSIQEGTFHNNRLTTVTIPSNITSIGESAFQKNPLTTIKNETGRSFNWKEILIDASPYHPTYTCTSINPVNSNTNFITGSCLVPGMNSGDPDFTVTITE